jgi:Flp pilus assembly protein TadG
VRGHAYTSKVCPDQTSSIVVFGRDDGATAATQQHTTIPTQCDTSNQARGCTYTSKNCPYQTSPFWKQQQHSHHPTTYNDLPLTAISSIPFDTLFFQQQTLLLSP